MYNILFVHIYFKNKRIKILEELFDFRLLYLFEI